jgi:hypothetical protein
MTLDYIALSVLLVMIALVAYGVIAVWGIPYEIAKRRGHPHQDAIGAATWVSLFTFGVLWPFLWIWALTYRPDRGWGFAKEKENDAFAELQSRVSALERALEAR